ncbi:hypothetical protein NDU88_006202 [Pleurodeles waltl]|uniref:Uncharacterized protein n=1 Tax=Pleurodeles waltl TaxID=8319 RepID=A0AAV7TX48_PLEWA|nr:hypothetical protein NDU88_006202 [Pleurodeles waltl]
MQQDWLASVRRQGEKLVLHEGRRNAASSKWSGSYKTTGVVWVRTCVRQCECSMEDPVADCSSECIHEKYKMPDDEFNKERGEEEAVGDVFLMANVYANVGGAKKLVADGG